VDLQQKMGQLMSRFKRLHFGYRSRPYCCAWYTRWINNIGRKILRFIYLPSENL